MPSESSLETEAADLLREAGIALYGSRWQSELARALEIGDRRVREFVQSERRTPDWIWPRIRTLMAARSLALAVVRKKLPR